MSLIQSPPQQTFDVVVLGGGGSGMAAAIAAAETGATVLLLEKTSSLGGTTRLSVGSITAASTLLQKANGIHDSPDEHFDDMSLFLSPEMTAKENLELRRVLVDNVPETLEWLTQIGLCFHGPLPEPPHKKPRMHIVLPNSRAYAYFLEKECRRLNVVVRLETKVQRLMHNNNGVTGVVADVGYGPCEFIARGGVILASGSAPRLLSKRPMCRTPHMWTQSIQPAWVMGTCWRKTWVGGSKMPRSCGARVCASNRQPLTIGYVACPQIGG